MIRVLRENKKTPDWVEAAVAAAGGLNPFGEPNFRIVWGWSRLGWIGGKWADRDETGVLLREVVELRQEPKYFPHDRWHLERWMPPESFGSPEHWEANTVEAANGIRVPALGPYPSRGDWEHVLTIQTPGGDFLGLTPAICDHIVRAIRWADRQPKAKKREALDDARARQERDHDNFVNSVLWNEPRFHAQPYVVAG